MTKRATSSMVPTRRFRRHPGAASRCRARTDTSDAAASLREGLEDIFTVGRLGIDGHLARTFTNANCIDSMIATARTAPPPQLLDSSPAEEGIRWYSSTPRPVWTTLQLDKVTESSGGARM